LEIPSSLAIASAGFFALKPAMTDFRSLATSALLRRVAFFAAAFRPAGFLAALTDLTAITFFVF